MKEKDRREWKVIQRSQQRPQFTQKKLDKRNDEVYSLFDISTLIEI
jgi:hypothetical protein